MRLSQAVEWTLHSCVNLAWVQGPVPAARLARLYQLPAAYLNKQLQALVRADILVSVPGAHGGFRLARDPADISLLDVVVAVEGSEEAFRCAQIVQRGPGGDPNVDYRHFCAIAQSMRRADLAWRRELAARTIADVAAEAARHSPDAPERIRTALAR
ncbi:RrF2 family transcriptional regulator [Thermocrispum municipale]|uniref:RrF2 family transcriptional regulator n=1 Tax=Thermocrispum municipale TaxID=37926 RepID=UPI00048F67F8|nr:Rrf2 family transcriptional regulator [Thermocrispum municipale]